MVYKMYQWRRKNRFGNSEIVGWKGYSKEDAQKRWRKWKKTRTPNPNYKPKSWW